MCDEWKNDFQAFADWSMEHGYKDPPTDGSQSRAFGLTIDRIDDDKGYFPENCQWITLRANIMKKRRFANYRSHEGKEFIKWLENECATAVDEVFEHATWHDARQVRNFIAFYLTHILKVNRMTMFEKEHILRARAFSLRLIQLLREGRSA